MHKTKLGISVGLVGAFISFLALFFNVTDWFFVALIAFILWHEDNTWLRKLVIKVAIISLILLLIPYAVDLVLSIIIFFADGCDVGLAMSVRSINSYIDIYSWSSHISFYIDKIVIIIKVFIFAALGIKSLNQRHFKMKRIDKLIDKNI